MPAQLITISTWLNLALTALAMAATEASDDTSHLTAMASRPAACTSFTVSRGVTQIGDRDMYAFIGQPFGESLPDASGSAGDDSDFVLVTFGHFHSPKTRFRAGSITYEWRAWRPPWPLP